MPNEQFGARFFDAQKRDRGRASKVVKSPLRVQQTDVEGESYVFAWASGYENGATVRIQGVLQNT